MADRYFVETPIIGDRATLVAAEAHHLAHVMRAKPGMEMTLFDGGGDEFLARVEKVGRAEIVLEVLARNAIDREASLRLTLAVALPKGDRQRWLIEKAVELGVTRFVPLCTARSVAQPESVALNRLRRAVIEASKQCGRNRLMQVAEAQTFAEVLAEPADARTLAHPGGEPLARLFATGGGLAGPALEPRSMLLAVGPEGGFTAEEVQQARERSWKVVDLGARILRVETAALMLAAIVAARSEPAGH